MTKLDFAHEACATTFMSIPDLTSGELTTLVNACHEAAAWRAQNKLPNVEKVVRLEEKLKRLVENLGERVEAWSADEWDEVDWGAEALDSMALESEALDPETEDTADLIIAVYSKHDGKVVDVRSFKNLSVVP